MNDPTTTLNHLGLPFEFLTKIKNTYISILFSLAFNIAERIKFSGTFNHAAHTMKKRKKN